MSGEGEKGGEVVVGKGHTPAGGVGLSPSLSAFVLTSIFLPSFPPGQYASSPHTVHGALGSAW